MSSKKKTGVTLSPRRNGLSKAARELLARVKVAASPEVIFGLEPAMAAAKVQSVVGPMIEGAGLPVALLQEYRWYVAELCRLMRMMSGPDLAYCMERAIRKWLSLGLEPNTVVFLAGALFERLQTRPETEGTQPQRHEDTKVPEPERRTAKDAKSAMPETEGNSPPRHQDTKGSESENAEVRNQIPECRSADADEETAKDAKIAMASGVTPTPMEGSRTGEIPPLGEIAMAGQSQERAVGMTGDDARSNDERRTMDEVTNRGGGP